MTWTLIEHRTIASSVEDFIGLAGKDEILVLVRAATPSSSGRRTLRVSIDNGSSFLTSSGDYIEIENDGSSSNLDTADIHATSSSSARGGAMLISGFQLTTEKVGDYLNRDNVRQTIIPTANAINAIRIRNTAGDLTGGTISLYARAGAPVWGLIESRAVNGIEDFTGLSGYSDIRVLLDAVTLSATGVRNVTVSTDNGSTWLTTSGDYQFVDTNGVETNAAVMTLHGTSSAAARSASMSIYGFNVSGAPKVAKGHNRISTRIHTVTTTLALNALRVNCSGAGAPNGGTIHLYGRP